jgi:2'-5' RNA ligase
LGLLFSGVPIPASLKRVRPDELHLTLRFLGDTPVGKVPVLIEVLSAVARGASPFLVRPGRLGGFPDLEGPRVLFLEMSRGREGLLGLGEAIDQALRGGEFPERAERFHPHLTLARCKEATKAREVVRALKGKRTDLPAASLGGFTLFESRPGGGGSRYQAIREFPLGK